MPNRIRPKVRWKSGEPPPQAHGLPDALETRPVGRAFRPVVFLTALTLACLVPFCGKAFHIDDTLFIWAAQQIVKHPLNPYGFSAVWVNTAQPMWEITKNPPLASYFGASVGAVAGWSEEPLHLAFLLFAIAAVVGTYYLARKLTRNPVLAATATLLAPGFLASSTTLMCDTMMLAFWIWAVILWIEGLDRKSAALLSCSGIFVAVCALTKYFGISLIPLLLAYSLAGRRRPSRSVLYLLIPVAFLAAYRYWAQIQYGWDPLSDVAEFATNFRSAGRIHATLTGLSFAGGCALPVIAFIPVVWSRRAILLGGVLAAAAGLYCALSGALGPMPAAEPRWAGVSVQFALFAAGGMSVLALAFFDWWKRKDADSLLLLLWVWGTFGFAALLNWTVNARSVLPMIPAAGILLARRFDKLGPLSGRAVAFRAGAPLLLSGVVALWVAGADAGLAGSARSAAEYMRDSGGVKPAELSFQGHWGFQYYMQSFGSRPIDLDNPDSSSPVMAIPENNTSTLVVPPAFVASKRVVAFKAGAGISTMSVPMGAGFYSDIWGPLPYAFGSVPDERYAIIRLRESDEPPPEGSR